MFNINTLKGKGYAPAEKNKEAWHYNGPFKIETGKPLYEMTEEDYSDISLNYLLDKMKKDPAVVAITSGTPTVMGSQRIREKKPEAVRRCRYRRRDSRSTCFRNRRKWRKTGLWCLQYICTENL